MKSLPSLRPWPAAVVVLAVFIGATIGGAPVFAAIGLATSSATPSDAAPDIGDTIVVTIAIDVSGVNAPDNNLGSFTGTLDWDPAVLAYSSNSGILAGFTGVVNPTSAATGHMIFNGANVSGATGNVTVLTINFGVVGAGSSALDLQYSTMAAAATFANLLPLLTVTDGQVVVGSANHSLTMGVDPVGGGTTDPAVGVHSYASGAVVNVTASPAAPYEFDHWSGACTGSGACSVTMDADKAITAHFTEMPLACYSLTLSHAGQGNDPVADPTNSAGCPSGRYLEGQAIGLSGAIPDAGWRISGWTGTSQDSSTAGANSLTMPASAHVASVVYKAYINLPAIFAGVTGGGAGLSQTTTTEGNSAIAAAGSNPDTQSQDGASSEIPMQQIAREPDTQELREPGAQEMREPGTHGLIEGPPIIGANEVIDSSNSEPDAGGLVSNPPKVSTQQGATGQPLIADPDYSAGDDLISLVPDSPIHGSSGTIVQRSRMIPVLLALVALVVLAVLAVLVGSMVHLIKHESVGSE